MAEYLAEKNIPVSMLFHSGKLRARQTADIFARVLKVEIVQAIDGLNPNDNAQQIAAKLEPGAMYIGHLPQLQRLLAYLVCADSAPQLINFENAGVLCLRGETAADRIDWYVRPSLLV